MASDILIVDDEADIRDLVAGILDDEGFTTRTARDSDSALAATAGTGEAGPRRSARRDDLRARQYRDRGRGHQTRRLRLYRETLQVRPAHSGGDAGAGDVASEA